ncbi:Adducin-related protein 1, putative [Brugia malayi]|uniref:Adducin-related protein 1, putative n=1 Tax=Brugia malayi TaxID=6279 RepID=A0A4E9ES21_BRUMA|nr:Adducin-related protein 1, putative [Brugia malayi]VIO86096.1 Adducin-related protein 1, putative [Brugia malayi]
MPSKTDGASNGTAERSFVNFDPEDPEYIKELQRPAAIKEDLSEMERRKRVQEVLESKSFCRELEELIKQESESHKSDPDHLKTLQRLSELTLPHGQIATSSLHNIGVGAVLPIADLKGSGSYTRAEKMFRNKLASLYRLVDLFQWSQGIYNHITLKLPDSDELLINPFGLLYHEITASSLIKINLNGEIIDRGSTKLGINQAGYVLHAAIHKARPDVRCVLHMHTAVVSAISSMKCGLLPLSQEAMIIGPVGYHDYQGILDDESEMESIVKDLGDKNVMLLRSHGFVACGESVEDALHLAFNTVIACETQIRAARAGIENLVIPNEKAVERVYKTARKGGGGVDRNGAKDAEGKQINWRIGELEWEAWMRVLDNAGYRTGHIYRQPLFRSRALPSSTNNQNDVAVPPSASSIGTVDETDYESVTAHKMALLRKEQERSRWLNSPNAYQKIEILETGTNNPKRITKWVQDVSSPSQSGTPVKISSPHQFSPFSSNPKEFKEKQKAIKENRRLGTTSAGPQSQILDGVTYEEIAQIRADAETSDMGQADRVVMIGTASKGIIDRQHQHNAQVYRQLYAPNPFASETDEDIQKYMKEVEAKTPRPSSAADSTEHTTSSPPLYENDSPSVETISLMQAAREHRTRPTFSGMASASIDEEGAPTEISVGTHSSPVAQPSTGRVGRLTLETTFDESDLPQSRFVRSSPFVSSTLPYPIQLERPKTLPSGAKFARSKSDRFASLRKNLFSKRNDTAVRNSEMALSDDELNQSKESKKKKRGLFSFGRKKK